MYAVPAPRGTPLYDAAALRGIEASMATRLGDDFALMARAGQAAWRELLARWPDVQRIVVVCGPGNNGGDGYELCRYAHESGRDARVLRIDAHAPRTALAQRACQAYREAGGRIKAFDDGFGRAQLVVDALFGIGLSREPDADAARVIDAINASGLPVFSLDVPSGLDADRGSAPGRVVHATHTLQLLAPHAGLYTGAAARCTGSLALATLDAEEALAQAPVAAIRLGQEDLRDWIPLRARDAHKGDSGHVLCIGGDTGKGGAVLLAADAALRCGAGLVSVATRPGHVPALLARRPEAMGHGLDDAGALAPLLERADVVAVGPGLGQEAWGAAFHDLALASTKPLVLDADALNLLARRTRVLPAGTILTPHPGEAARLLGFTTAEVQANRFAAARLLAEMFGCVVVLKGAGTLVAAPEQVPRVIAAGNPGMAVGGMGDLLTGCIAALRALGLDAFDAACRGALLHAVAGDAAAADGERGLLPSDLLGPLRTWVNGGPGA
ncbi:NAD(P)H-hydrate dehydratase [Luteimonas kalidii]|uniref:Bifunctional NAD(P)H-hydrate repair enzyme n=1 Tax=Luteimonas kalidii TaxID=3042025 RepID=A0ABT6JTM9_9GAMM|nr:NAD(P)H-hydrate dehydratase [Luteimonas kalidii]MDH5834033.1 NAD(P)H-hydrate dehydratase [Luteimonas kalidii]